MDVFLSCGRKALTRRWRCSLITHLASGHYGTHRCGCGCVRVHERACACAHCSTLPEREMLHSDRVCVAVVGDVCGGTTRHNTVWGAASSYCCLHAGTWPTSGACGRDSMWWCPPLHSFQPKTTLSSSRARSAEVIVLFSENPAKHYPQPTPVSPSRGGTAYRSPQGQAGRRPGRCLGSKASRRKGCA